MSFSSGKVKSDQLYEMKKLYVQHLLRAKTDQYISSKRPIYSCCSHVTSFLSGKAKTGLYMSWKKPTYSCYSCKMISACKKAKKNRMATCNCCSDVALPASEKTKQVGKARPTHSCCSHNTSFAHGKAKTGQKG